MLKGLRESTRALSRISLKPGHLLQCRSVESSLPALTESRKRWSEALQTPNARRKDLLRALAFLVQTDERGTNKCGEQLLVFGGKLVEMSLGESVLLHRRGILPPHDLAAIVVLLHKSILHRFG